MSRLWTPEEDATLRDLYGSSSMRTLMRYLNRSAWAIRLRARRLGLRVMENGEGVTMAELGRCLGVAAATVQRWVKADGLPARPICLTERHTVFKISPSAFWVWAASHRDRIDWTKVDPNVLPPEPAWVQPLRLAGAGRDKYEHHPTTTQNIERIRALRERGLTHKEIAAATGRTTGSVRYIIRRYLTER